MGTTGRAALHSAAARMPNRIMSWECGATAQPQPKMSCDGRPVPGAMGIAVSGNTTLHGNRPVTARAHVPQEENSRVNVESCLPAPEA